MRKQLKTYLDKMPNNKEVLEPIRSQWVDVEKSRLLWRSRASMVVLLSMVLSFGYIMFNNEPFTAYLLVVGVHMVEVVGLHTIFAQQLDAMWSPNKDMSYLMLMAMQEEYEADIDITTKGK